MGKGGPSKRAGRNGEMLRKAKEGQEKQKQKMPAVVTVDSAV